MAYGFSTHSRYSDTSSLYLFCFYSRLSHNHITSFNTTTYFQLHRILTATNSFERRLSRPSTHSLHTQHQPIIQKCASAIRETTNRLLHLGQYPNPVDKLSPRPARGLKRRRMLSVQRQSALNASQAPQCVIETRLKRIQRLRAHTGRLSACHSSTEQYFEASVAGKRCMLRWRWW